MTIQTQAMTAAPTADSPPKPARAPALAKPARQPSMLKAHLELSKFRLNAMVVFSTALGFVVASRFARDDHNQPISFQWMRLVWTCLGTFLCAAGASAFNQAIEARRDAKMHRTRHRPLCTGQLSRTYAAAFGLILSITGITLLAFWTTAAAAAFAAANIVIYALLYTPLKPVSTVNTMVGAVVGAIPPMLGWAAVSTDYWLGAATLGAILFVWQIPHFLALCWLYREDYARGGFKMLPVIDKSGFMTTRLALLYAIFLLPLSITLFFQRHAGVPFLAISSILNLGIIMIALRFFSTRDTRDARRLFFASIIYLPILSITLMADARDPGAETLLANQRAADATPFIDPGSREGMQLSAQYDQQNKDAAAPASATPTPAPASNRP